MPPEYDSETSRKLIALWKKRLKKKSAPTLPALIHQKRGKKNGASSTGR